MDVHAAQRLELSDGSDDGRARAARPSAPPARFAVVVDARDTAPAAAVLACYFATFAADEPVELVLGVRVGDHALAGELLAHLAPPGQTPHVAVEDASDVPEAASTLAGARHLLAAFAEARARARERARNAELRPALDLSEVFGRIYREGTWTDGAVGMPVSGPGSLPENSRPVIDWIADAVRAGRVSSIVDLGCGDLTYLLELPEVTSGRVAYRGYDVVPELVESHRRLPWGEFEVADITAPGFRVEADLVVVKDVLFHLPTDLALHVIDNLRFSRWRWLLMSCGGSPTNAGRNLNDHHHWAPINLKLPPFSLRPHEVLERPMGGSFLVFTPEGVQHPA